jgi:hypothetical protein
MIISYAASIILAKLPALLIVQRLSYYLKIVRPIVQSVMCFHTLQGTEFYVKIMIIIFTYHMLKHTLSPG